MHKKNIRNRLQKELKLKAKPFFYRFYIIRLVLQKSRRIQHIIQNIFKIFSPSRELQEEAVQKSQIIVTKQTSIKKILSHVNLKKCIREYKCTFFKTKLIIDLIPI